MALLTMTGVHESFGRVAALGAVDSELEAGAVHALVGSTSRRR